jgi:hypothetical protein
VAGLVVGGVWDLVVLVLRGVLTGGVVAGEEGCYVAGVARHGQGRVEVD